MSDADWQPLHAGEIALQRRAGVADRIGDIARRVIRDHMPDQHREFFALLPTVLLGAVDADGWPVATMLADDSGFMQSPDPDHLHLRAAADVDDPVLAALTPGAQVGVLGLQPHTRRRNRMNGEVLARDAAGLRVKVIHSFGNCPKYIQGREPQRRAPSAAGPAQRGGARLGAALQARIERADTLFIASAGAVMPDAAHGVDVSHRGGLPGFVQCTEEGGHSVLTIPDYLGNFLFNTLGNLALNPRCGLLFVDYDDGTLLHVAGRAEVIWDGPAVTAYAGAERLLRIVVERNVLRPAALPLRWSAPAWSPVLPGFTDSR
jgi:uncharacterized protein